QLDFRPFDKVPIPDLVVYNCSHHQPVSLTFSVKNQVLKGLENATILSVKGFDRDPTKNMIIIGVRIPRMEIEGTYEYQAKLFLAQFNGTGPIKADLQNVRLTIIFKAYVEFRNGKRFLKVYNLESQVQLDRFIILLDNLNSENLDFSIVVNDLLNDHWLEFWNELEPIFLPYINEMGVKRLKRFFHHFSYDAIFIQDDLQ
ncbi:uncharacterized protein LOC108108877, partial [Drosophila eugracilis]|uniref:uncharacterized protein LOC108108877 n=1 Tax=Drosophila eugracilis TaxID=29029 RepID=UPI0007E706CB